MHGIPSAVCTYFVPLVKLSNFGTYVTLDVFQFFLLHGEGATNNEQQCWQRGDYFHDSHILD